MTTHTQHRLVAIASLAACALLAACSGGSSPGRATTAGRSPADSPRSSAVPASTASVTADVASTSTAATVVLRRSACALVTEDDATTALGNDPGRGSAFASHGSTQCQYGSYQTQFVLVNLTPSRGRAGYDLMHGHRAAGQNVSTVDIGGVGDRAFEITAPHTAGIYANKGDALLVVTITRQAIADPPTIPLVALAKLAVSRL